METPTAPPPPQDMGRAADTGSEATPRAPLESLIEHLNEVVFQTDASGLWSYLNPAWTRITGFDVEESLGVCFLDYVHPDDQERNQEAFRPLIEREKEVCRHEVRYITADGGSRWVEVHARLMEAEDGSIVGTSGTLKDITERRAAEAAARRLAQEQGAHAESERARARVERILETMGEGFLALDVEGRVTYVNRAAELLLDRERSDLVGRPLAEALPELPVPPMERSGEGIEPVGYVSQVVNRNGRYVDVAAHGSDEGYSVYIRDVTHEREAHASLRKRLRVEAVLAKVSPLLLTGSEEDTDVALAELGRLVDVSRAYVFTLEASRFSNSHEWCAPGVLSLLEQSQGLAAARYPWLTDRLIRGDTVSIPDVSELSSSAEQERMALAGQGIHSALAVPVIGPGGELQAFLGFDDVRAPREWSADDIRALEVTAQMLASRTARDRAEDALRRSEERYRLATRATRDTIYEWDVLTGAMERAGAFQSAFGHAQNGDIEWWKSQIHPDDAEAVIAGLNAALTNGSDVWSDEYRLRRDDGDYAVVLDRAYIIRGDDRSAVRVIGSMSDITDRRAADDALRRSQARLAEAERIAGLGSWEVDLSTGRCVWSREVYSLFRRDPALGPMSMWEFHESVHEDDLGQLAIALRQAQENGEPIEVTHRVVLPDGSERHHEVTAEVVHSHEGPLRLVGVSRDITERRELEAQLRQSQRLEAVALLAGGVAHDFNNVLSAISAAAELTRMEMGEDDPAASDLDEILDGVRRGAALTRQLLGFSGKRLSQPALLDPNELVSDLRKMLSRLLPEDVHLKLDLAPELDAIFMDPGQLEQVLMNLVVNARDAMSKGGALTIETAPASIGPESSRAVGPAGSLEPGHYVRLSVSDTGHGMDPETLAKVFDPFFTTKAPGRGTGLGLATVNGIVRDLGGGISVRSVPGEGSSFDIFLPRADTATSSDASAHIVESTLAGGDETILVVDDEPTLSRLARRLLEGRGYTVIESNDPEDALSRASTHEGPIHLLLSDVVMPGMNGVELAERMSRELPDLRVVLMSGHIGDALLERGIPPGGPTLLDKPLSYSGLLRAVRLALDEPGRGVGDTAAADAQ